MRRSIFSSEFHVERMSSRLVCSLNILGSSSKSQNQTNNTTTQSSTNTNFQDVQGPAIYGSGNTIQLTDQGALEAAGQVGVRAIDAVSDTASQSLANSRDALRDSLDFGDSALQRVADFGDIAITGINDVSSDALARVQGSARDALDFGAGLVGDALARVQGSAQDVLDFAAGIFSDAVSAQSKLTDANLAGLTSLAKQTSASSDDRVQKIAIYAVIAVAAAMVLPRIFGKS